MTRQHLATKLEVLAAHVHAYPLTVVQTTVLGVLYISKQV